MSELSVLNVEKREITNSRKSKQLRKGGYIPASISGKGKNSISVAVKKEDLTRSINKYGRNALFKLSIDNNEQVTGMVRGIQYSPVKAEMLHVDLQQVSLSEEIKADVTIKLKGLESLDFKKLMAIPQFDAIRVKGLPQDIPDDITIDVSNINRIENILVKDVEFPKGIAPEIDQELCVVSIVETRRSEAKSEEEPVEEASLI